MKSNNSIGSDHWLAVFDTPTHLSGGQASGIQAAYLKPTHKFLPLNCKETICPFGAQREFLQGGGRPKQSLGQ